MITSKCDRHLVQIANDNDPSQVVISGEKKEVEKFSDLLKQKNAKRILNLPVSAPFHSPLMEPAASKMEGELKKVNFSNPIVPIMHNVDLSVAGTMEGFADKLVKQICGTVRWRESLIKMVTEFEINSFFEIGPGKVLAGTVKRTVPNSDVISVSLAPHIDEALEILNE